MKNSFLMERLGLNLDGVEVSSADEHGDSREQVESELVGGV